MADDPDFIPEETAAMSIARIANAIDPHGDVLVASQSLEPDVKLWQHSIDSNYQARVANMDKETLSIARKIICTISAMDVPILQSNNSESDDTAGRVAIALKKAGARVSIVSNSPKLLPLVCSQNKHS